MMLFIINFDRFKNVANFNITDIFDIFLEKNNSVYIVKFLYYIESILKQNHYYIDFVNDEDDNKLNMLGNIPIYEYFEY